MTSRFADPDFFLDRRFPEVLAHLRAHSPVNWCQARESLGFWAIARYEGIEQVFAQPLVFSSAVAGNIIPANPDFHRADREAMGFDAMPTNTGPPKHGEVWRLFARHLSGFAVAKLELLTQRIFDEILDEVRPRGDCNFVLDVAAHLPARLICEVLGVPREDWPMISDYANSFASFTDPDLQPAPTPADTFRLAVDSLFSYISDRVEQRRAAPQDDFASIAACAEWNGAPLQRRRVPSLAFCHGPHNCIGRMLALLEVKVVTQTLLARTDRIELIGPVSYIASTIARGPKYMPVRIHWA